MKPFTSLRASAMAVLLLIAYASLQTGVEAANAVLIGWSDLGLHETDGSDASVYSLQPPYSTVRAQFIVGGKLVKSTNGVSVTYEAIGDSSGSTNSTSLGKGNFYRFSQALYGVTLSPDQGLAGFAMPGSGNQPQAMTFDPAQNWFSATGIPITPSDDQGHKNSYPMMRLVARDSAGNLLASTDVVLPVTDEMDCRACHASGSQAAARPATGWAWECDSDKDSKLNVLRYHDQGRVGSSSYTDVLNQVGYNPAGLVATVTQDGKPVLCIRCHPSNALPGSGAPGMRPLTRLIHTKHAKVLDPELGQVLDDVNKSSACFRCHAGPETRYLRGVHHQTVNADGSLALQCQNCHGSVTDLGSKTRQGWLDLPNCQSCHTGTATQNGGQLRYTNVFSASGLVRQAANQIFATQTNTPAAGLQLYRSSSGHGGLQCAACHGSTHAELPSSQANDNVQSQQLQGHVGALVECTACHPTVPNSVNGGPHGLHPVGQTWVSGHRGPARSLSQCQTCHGADSRGTVLALSQSDQFMNVSERGGARLFWRGSQIGCYNCHGGPSGDGGSRTPASAINQSASTTAETPVPVTLQASGTSGTSLAFRIIAQPAHGTVSLSANMATYFPAAGFVGNDTFTFSAWNAATDSTLGTATMTVAPGNCALTASAMAPTAALPGATVPFRASASLARCQGTLVYDWDFGDGSPHAAQAEPCHPYTVAGEYAWKLTVTANNLVQVINGVVTISPQLGPPLSLTLTISDGVLTVAWPADRIGTSLETSSDPTQPDSWQPVEGEPVIGSATISLQLPASPDPQFFRVRRMP